MSFNDSLDFVFKNFLVDINQRCFNISVRNLKKKRNENVEIIKMYEVLPKSFETLNIARAQIIVPTSSVRCCSSNTQIEVRMVCLR